MEPSFEQRTREKIDEISAAFRKIEPDRDKLQLLDAGLLQETVRDVMQAPSPKIVSLDLKKSFERQFEKIQNISSEYGSPMARFYYKDLVITRDGTICALGYVLNRDLYEAKRHICGISSSPDDHNVIAVRLGRISASGLDTGKLEEYSALLEELRARRDERNQPEVLFETTAESMYILRDNPAVGIIAKDKYDKTLREQTPEQVRERTLKRRDTLIDHLHLDAKLAGSLLGDGNPDILLRIPLEAVESAGPDNARPFIEAFQEAPNCYIEIFKAESFDSSGEDLFARLGLEKKQLPEGFKSTRYNTVTLIPVHKNEKMTASTLISCLGNMYTRPMDTIISPLGLHKDPTGLIRSSLLGLKIMRITREILLMEEKGLPVTQEFKDEVQLEIMESFKEVCDPGLRDTLAGLTPDDIIDLASSDNINKILEALNKLIKLLPIEPLDIEDVRRIYDHARRSIIAA